MKTVLVGYGRMGHEIEAVLVQRGHEITCRVDPGGNGDAERVSAEVLKGADAVIEFALAPSVVENAALYAESGVSAVVGTTGWDSRRDEVRRLVEEKSGSYLWGSNFSLGAHILFILAEKAAALVDGVPEYDIMVNEFHHKMKKDSPSGTAITIAEKILDANSRKTVIQTEKLDRPIRDEELHVASVRGGSIPGVHSVTLDSPADTVTVTHSARNRGVFALGAVMAAEWLAGKKGFFRVEDFIKEKLS